VTWDHNKELHLAMRALRAELNRIASQVDKQLKWFDKAIAEWEQAEGANREVCIHGVAGPCGRCTAMATLVNPPSPDRPSAPVPQAGILLPGVFCVCGEPAPCPEHPAGTFRLTEQ
jgi:hypothetical protein